ncbi:MAG: DUF58 domain-containing protein [Deltaproteobacteria bacterium]|nr:DUF58 domain-containing protein [Deltaproteobacteria bacterium]
MLPRELIKKIRRIQIVTSRRADESFVGQYRSVFRGRGMEFDEVRAYAWGDDVRSIDWNVTARTSIPHIKRYNEERELTVFLLVDVSGSQRFGSTDHLKSEVAAEVAALLAFSAIKNRDKVGALFFTDEVEKVLPPAAGPSHVLRVVREILLFRPHGHGTDVAGALRYLGRILKRRAIVFVISDFLGPGLSEGELKGPLRRAARRHDVVAIRIRDPRELELPQAGLVRMCDAETGADAIFDLGSRRVREHYQEAAAARDRSFETTLTRSGVDLISLRTDQPYELPLGRFFRERARRIH